MYLFFLSFSNYYYCSYKLKHVFCLFFSFYSGSPIWINFVLMISLFMQYVIYPKLGRIWTDIIFTYNTSTPLLVKMEGPFLYVPFLTTWNNHHYPTVKSSWHISDNTRRKIKIIPLFQLQIQIIFFLLQSNKVIWVFSNKCRKMNNLVLYLLRINADIKNLW